MNLKKMEQKQTKKILDAIANHPEKKKVKDGVDLEKIAQTLTDRKFAKNKTSSKENLEEE